MLGENRIVRSPDRVMWIEAICALTIGVVLIILITVIIFSDYHAKRRCEERGGEPVYTDRQIICLDPHVLR